MDKFFGFMEGAVGRVLRIALGVALIWFGLGRMGGVGGLVVAVAGLLPVVMGAWGPCLVHLAMGRVRRA
jgi:hypothetical protein